MSEHESPIHRAIRLLGGPSAAGRVFNVTHEAVRKWLDGRSRLSGERCVEIEAATGGAVSRYDLRPDIFGAEPERLPNVDQTPETNLSAELTEASSQKAAA